MATNEDCIVLSTDKIEAILTEVKIGKLFQNTSSLEELGKERLQSSYQELQAEALCPQMPVNVMQI